MIKLGKRKEKYDIRRLAEYESKLREYEKELEEENDACRIHMLNPSRICSNPAQPRKYFDESSLESLAESIKQYGMIQPLTVRRLSDEDSPFGGLYELVAGERRLRAARIIQMQYVPAIIIDADRDESAKIALVENLQRHELNFFEEAEAMESLIKKYGVKQIDLAAALSVSQSYVANKLRLLRLDPKERESVINSGLSERHVRAVLRLPSPELRKKALNAASEKEYNVQQTEKYVAELMSEKAPKCRKKIVIKDIRIFLNTIDRAVGIVRQAGIPVEQSRSDDDGMIELKIRVPNNTAVQ